MTVVFLATLGIPGLAAAMYQGRPTGYDSANAASYQIWQEGNRWHVLTVNNTGARHSFAGKIETNGVFAEVLTMPAENSEGVTMKVENAKIEFQINSFATSNWFSFRIVNSQNATFALYIDGVPVNPFNIYLGRQNLHPNGNAFSVSSSEYRSPPYDSGILPSYDQPILFSDAQGKPTAMSPGAIFGYFIWQEDDRWILQTTTNDVDDKERLFTGTIETDGTISNVEKLKSQRTDGVIDEDTNKISFKFKTSGPSKGFSFSRGDNTIREWPDKVSGMSFLTTDTTNLRFKLFADGQPIDPASIYIGRNNRHPAGNDWKIYFRK
jgi:hypothetical protein